MTKPHETWTVAPHGPLTKLDSNLWSVVGEIDMPLGHFPRRMTVVRLAGGDRLVVFSAIALEDADMAQLEALGNPAFLVVPSARHRLDVKPWKARYPNVAVVAPRGARAKVEELVPVDSTSPDFGDPNVTFVTMPGTNDGEAALRVVSDGGGVTLVINELVFNVPTQPGFGGWLFEKLGMTGSEPHMPALIERKDVHDKAALANQLRAWSKEDVRRVIVSHGNVVETGARELLSRLAAELSPS